MRKPSVYKTREAAENSLWAVARRLQVSENDLWVQKRLSEPGFEIVLWENRRGAHRHVKLSFPTV